MKYIVTSMKLEDKLRKELKILAVEKEITMSELIKILFENYKKQKENNLNVGQ